MEPVDQNERPSRSAKKRASTALQNLGEELAALKPADRQKLDLPPELAEALEMLDRITDREARRRQKQFIGKVMRGVEIEPILAQLGNLQSRDGAGR